MRWFLSAVVVGIGVFCPAAAFGAAWSQYSVVYEFEASETQIGALTAPVFSATAAPLAFSMSLEEQGPLFPPGITMRNGSVINVNTFTFIVHAWAGNRKRFDPHLILRCCYNIHFHLSLLDRRDTLHKRYGDMGDHDSTGVGYGVNAP